MAYVNYLGDEIGLIDHGRAPKAKPETEPFHKGWRVIGVPPAALAEARRANRANRQWDEPAWLMTAKQKPLRTKPYALRNAAVDCAELAKKAGWLRVEIVEIRRGEAPKKNPFTTNTRSKT